MPKTIEQLERELGKLQLVVEKLLAENRELKRWQLGVDMALKRENLINTIERWPRRG